MGRTDGRTDVLDGQGEHLMHFRYSSNRRGHKNILIYVILTLYNHFFGPEAYMIYGTITENYTQKNRLPRPHSTHIHCIVIQVKLNFQSIVIVELYHLIDEMQINCLCRSGVLQIIDKNKIPSNSKRF